MAWKLLPLLSLLLAPAGAKNLVKVGEGQCNGGVGGTGEHKCLIGGTCNEGGEPLKSPLEKGTGCPGDKEYLLCEEDTSITEASCKAACESDSECVAFLITRHEAKNAGRCELHTKIIDYVAMPLECYIRKEDDTFMLIGKGACRSKDPATEGPQAGQHYGKFEVVWVESLTKCEESCTGRSDCVGVEYHPTAVDDGSFKCEVHLEELSATQMSTFKCFVEDPTCKLHMCDDGEASTDSGTACAPDGEGGLTACSEELCCGDAADGAMSSHCVFLQVVLALIALPLVRW